jgi:DNA polymerase/3'-5' exonuclease PolX
MSAKQKFPRADAIAVAKELCDALRPYCDRLIVAGSLRRRKQEVGDVEILFVPRTAQVSVDLFETEEVSLVDHVLHQMIREGVLAMRLNVSGASTWGPKNRLALHKASAIPVDFFCATPANWFNLLVCRTGSAESNVSVASAALRKNWKWHPYREGFTNEHGLTVPVTSERDVFEYVGMPYREPWEL